MTQSAFIPGLRRAALGLLAAALVAAVHAVPAWAQARTAVRVGFVSPMTGASSDFGNSARYGAELAVAEINSVGDSWGGRSGWCCAATRASPMSPSAPGMVRRKQ